MRINIPRTKTSVQFNSPLRPNVSRKVHKLLLALKVLLGTVSGAAYVMENVKMAFFLLLAGAILEFLAETVSIIFEDDTYKGNFNTGVTPDLTD
jgi:hypothetical protein